MDGFLESQVLLFFHRFNVDAKVNELMQQQDNDLDDYFWCSQIRRLTNLVYLNLKLITTDEILVLVGQSCPKLEVVNIVSRMKQDINSELTPGITFKFCVSDYGLRALGNCKNLKKITMNKIVNSANSTDRGGISHQGIRELLSKLPRLEYISFGSIGKILNGEFPADSSFKLKFFSEVDPHHVDVDRIQRLCPHTQHVCLSVPINITAYGEINIQTGPCDSILSALAESDLDLRILDITHFPYQEAFKNLLRSKGKNLEELVYRSNNFLCSEHIQFIGEQCPNLQRLTLKDVGPERNRGVPTSSYGTLQRKLFQNLKSLSISGKKFNIWRIVFSLKLVFAHFLISGQRWNPTLLLTMLLASATDIRQITLINMSNYSPSDSALLKLLQHNQLKELQTLNLYSGCYVSMPLLRQFTFQCPKLNNLSFLQYDNIETAEVEAFRVEITAKNMDIKLCCLEMLDLP